MVHFDHDHWTSIFGIKKLLRIPMCGWVQTVLYSSEKSKHVNFFFNICPIVTISIDFALLPSFKFVDNLEILNTFGDIRIWSLSLMRSIHEVSTPSIEKQVFDASWNIGFFLWSWHYLQKDSTASLVRLWIFMAALPRLWQPCDNQVTFGVTIHDLGKLIMIIPRSWQDHGKLATSFHHGLRRLHFLLNRLTIVEISQFSLKYSLEIKCSDILETTKRFLLKCEIYLNSGQIIALPP